MSSFRISFCHRRAKGLVLLSGIGLLSAVLTAPLAGPEETYSVIIQGTDLASVKEAVVTAGGEITHELRIIGAVGAKLTATQTEAIRRADSRLRIHRDGAVQTQAATFYDNGWVRQE